MPVQVVTLADGSELSLGAVLARAGEGAIHLVDGHADWVAKVLHTHLRDRWAKVAKVTAMAASPPEGATQMDGFVVLTWPQFVIHDESGPCGYVMARIDTAKAVEIHAVTNPSARVNPPPSAPKWPASINWTHLVRIAANLCLAVDTIHRADAVIGDFQERNILVSDNCGVTLVDCDSFQFASPGGHQFLCTVARPEFVAPELADTDLHSHVREQSSDLFSLAIHIHQLLMGGNHPFLRGSWAGAGEQPDALTLAKSGSWAGAPGSPLLTHPLAPPPTFLPDDVAALFERALTDGARNPAARPNAAEWRDALLRIKITKCRKGVHQIPRGCYPCPWCTIVAEREHRKRPQADPTPTQKQASPHSDATTRTAPEPAAEQASPRRKRRFAAYLARQELVHSLVIYAGLWPMVLANQMLWSSRNDGKTFGTEAIHIGGLVLFSAATALVIGALLFNRSKNTALNAISIGCSLTICYTLIAELGQVMRLPHLQDLGFPETEVAWLWIAFGLCLPAMTLVAARRVS